jgi:hypothetical protein
MQDLMERNVDAQKERHTEIKDDVAKVRHRVNNMEMQTSQVPTLLRKVDNHEQRIHDIEINEAKEEAVTDYKRYIIGGSVLVSLIMIASLVLNLLDFIKGAG